MLTFVLLPPIVAGITVILQRAGALLPLYLWGFIFSLSLVMMTIYPTLIAPLFNKFDPLPEGPLRTKIEQLAGSLKFPLTKLYQVRPDKHRMRRCAARPQAAGVLQALRRCIAVP
jgi:STE24 endopeptidase